MMRAHTPAFAIPHSETVLAQAILKLVLQYRRVPSEQETCSAGCAFCQAPHLPKIITAIEEGRPISFVLPAFPGKSPNRAKVLGALPDMAEKLALQFLDGLCEQISEIYAPGAHMILCSDGRVFSDVVGMREMDVTGYQQELSRLIDELGFLNLSTFNLDELCSGADTDFSEARAELMERFGVPLESLREKVVNGDVDGHDEALRMFCGITRFLVEDASFPGQAKSRTAIQRECKSKAYEVIRRSNAWSALIAERFPDAVRLSIHPQGCGAKRLGIRLVGMESWMTPWHGVALKTPEGFSLLKRADAEALGARLVFSSPGVGSHYEVQGP